jgi:hypothetical protein
MTFIRLKSRKDCKGVQSHYAYLVENRWLHGRQRPKQKVKEYLGKALKPAKKPVDFYGYVKAKDSDKYLEKPYKELLSDLMLWELHQHLVKGLTLNLKEITIRNRGHRIVVAMNQGYLCDYTLNRLLSVKKNVSEEQPGYELAAALVGAGLETPKELFIALYEKLNGMGPR